VSEDPRQPTEPASAGTAEDAQVDAATTAQPVLDEDEVRVVAAARRLDPTSPTAPADPADPADSQPAARRALSSAPAPESDASTVPTTRNASVARSSILMASGTVASRALGLLRQVLIVAAIGQGLIGEAFTAANTLPNLLNMVIAGGVLNSVLIPQLVKAAKNPDGGREFTDRILTVAGSMIAAITVLATLASPLLIALVASQLPDDVERLAVLFAYITLPQVLFYGITALLGQLLNARGRFAAYGWAPALANVVAIAGLVTFMVLFHQARHPRDWTPAMIWWFAGSATLSIVVQALFLLIPLWRSGFRFTPRWGLRGVGLRQTSATASWAFAALAVGQLGYLVAANVMTHASGQQLARGHFIAGITVQSNALLVFMLPHSFIALSIITALYPRISQAVADGDLTALRADYVRGLRVPTALTLPSSFALIALAEPLCQFLFGGDPHEAHATALVVAAMALGVVPFGIDVLNQRMFYAQDAGRTAFSEQLVLTSTATAVNLTALALRPEMTVIVVGAGLVLSNLAAATYGLVRLRRRLGPFGGRALARTYATIALAGALSGLLAWTATRVVPAPGRWGQFVVLAVGGTLFAGAYLVLARLLRIRELDDILAPVLRGVRR